MIRRSDTSSFWQCAVCLAAVIAITGCGKSPPDGTPTHARTPKALKPLDEALAEADAEFDQPEMAPSAEVAESDAASSAKEMPPRTEQKPVEAAPAPNAAQSPKVALSVPDPPEYVYEPEVLMTKRDADSCLVKTGGAFPEGQLSDLDGQEHSLTELFGEKLTVVVFWDNANRLGREQIQRVETETVLPFANTGLSVIAINISDPPEQISELLPTDRKIGFTVLLDTDATLFSKVATGRHPRTYLLDAKGTILWFDIEYSRSTARDLANAIHVYLGDRKVGDS